MATAHSVSYHHSLNGNDVARCLWEAFRNDPVVRYYQPSDEQYSTFGVRFFRMLVWWYGKSHNQVDALVMKHVEKDNGEGADDKRDTRIVSAAVWEPPDPTLKSICLLLVLLAWMIWNAGPRLTFRMAKLLVKFEVKKHRLGRGASHLAFLGTGHGMTGKGLGSQCLRLGLNRADQAGIPCYLESSNPRNVPLYERHGFQVLETFKVDGSKGPVVTIMLREAKKTK